MGSPDTPSLTRVAHAKINLYLHLTGQRDDGYHELDTLFAFTDFGDRLGFSAAESYTLRQEGRLADELPDPQENLITRAAHLLADRAGVLPTANVVIDKVLPVAAGLGGGSADAAATLQALQSFWGLDILPTDMHEIALELGADVPVCLDSVPAHARGVGEILTPVDLPGCGVLLVNPGVALSTAAVFSKWHELGGQYSVSLSVASGWQVFEEMIAALKNHRNDLEEPAKVLVPEIEDILQQIAGLSGCALARMSGSGATCFGLFETADLAVTAGEALAIRRPGWWVEATSLRGTI